MKLFYSRSNPYARKVRACAIALGIDAQIELVEVDIADPPDALIAANPLGRVPTLVTGEGFAIFDSPVICEYLNGIAGTLPIVPATGAARWLALRLQAVGDGLMDVSIPLRHLLGSGTGDDHRLVMRYRDAITRTLGSLETQKLRQHLDVGTISVASALGYLDLRFPDLDWRGTSPVLARWYEEISKQDCLSRTAPV